MFHKVRGHGMRGALLTAAFAAPLAASAQQSGVQVYEPPPPGVQIIPLPATPAAQPGPPSPGVPV